MIQRVEAGRDLTPASLGQLGNALPDMVQNGVTAVRIDVSRVVEFDSSSLESLLEFEALARSRGLSVTVVAPGEMLASALQITGIDDRVDVEEAPKSMSQDEQASDQETVVAASAATDSETDSAS